MFQHLFQKPITRSNGMAQVIEIVGGDDRNRTGVHGFAIRAEIQRKQGGAVSKTPPTNHEYSKNVSNGVPTLETKNAATSAKVNGVKFMCTHQSTTHHTALDSEYPILSRHWPEFGGVAA